MRVRVLGPALAVAVVISIGQMAGAQNLAQVGAPVNPPPASFKGQQFIDARGCVFVRAGFGGQVNWVPRIDGRKKPICGMLPTGAAMAPDVAEVTVPAVQAPVQSVAVRAPGKGLFAFLFAPTPAPVLAPPPAPRAEVAVTFTQPVRALPKAPKGWQYAWKDDRLNPMRGIGTPAGQAAQNRLFTQEVPLTYIADLAPKEQAKALKVIAAQAAPQVAPQTAHVTVSTMSAPSAGLMVQVGCFGDPGNAQRVQGRIASAGLPFATTQQNGLTVVMAGPFGSAAQAAEGLAALRGAGFADAFVR